MVAHNEGEDNGFEIGIIAKQNDGCIHKSTFWTIPKDRIIPVS